MVGERRYRDAHRTSQTFWKNAEYEYDGAVFFRALCGARGVV